jgi:hypothetical protein
MPAKKSKKTSSRTKRSTAKKSSRKSAKTRQDPKKPSFWSSLTLDRKLDILGISMVLLGLLTLLSLLSSSNGWLSSGWLSIRSRRPKPYTRAGKRGARWCMRPASGGGSCWSSD